MMRSHAHRTRCRQNDAAEYVVSRRDNNSAKADVRRWANLREDACTDDICAGAYGPVRAGREY